MHPVQWVALVCGIIAFAALALRMPYAEAIAGIFGLVALGVLVTAPKRGDMRVTKACPDCGERIPKTARVCRFCGYRLPG
jgi:hypothetical protein